MSKHNRKISVIGLGYVGLPLAVELGKHDLVIGFDVDVKRISELRNNVDQISLISSNDLQESNVKYINGLAFDNIFCKFK